MKKSNFVPVGLVFPGTRYSQWARMLQLRRNSELEQFWIAPWRDPSTTCRGALEAGFPWQVLRISFSEVAWNEAKMILASFHREGDVNGRTLCICTKRGPFSLWHKGRELPASQLSRQRQDIILADSHQHEYMFSIALQLVPLVA